MDKFIIKVFGLNRMNFWGWVGAGLFVIVCCLVFFLQAQSALLKGDQILTIIFLLTAIGLLLLGHFGLALQTYISLYTEKLERQQAHMLNRGPEDDLRPNPRERRGTNLSGAEQEGIRHEG